MKISCISDVHAGTASGSNYSVMMDFLKHPTVTESDHIAFLGDVFDHLTGEHKEYLEKYEAFFERISGFVQKGVHVHFVEGNHDFHFRKTFQNFIRKTCGDKSQEFFHYERAGFDLKVGEKLIAFRHGDELDDQNKAYMRWKRIYSSKPFAFFVSNILPYKIVETVGERASENSRMRGKTSFDFKREKEKYREAAKRFLEGSNADAIVAGHTHIGDNFETPHGQYHNIGFPPRDRAFVLVTEAGIDKVLF